MSKKNKGIKLRKEKSIKGIISSPEIQITPGNEILFSFKYIDVTQSACHKKLEFENKLSKYWEHITEYSKKNIKEANSGNGKKFTIYGDFPPKHKTKFSFPKYISRDVNWARIHIGGKDCLIGFIVGNIFYIVFLDPKHEFFISEKKHT